MQVVPIPPTYLIPQAKELARMQFALVHLCDTRPDYVKAYAEIGRDPEHHLIMDNGAFEMGSSDILERVLHWAEVLRPDEIVLPDRMFMADETIHMSKEAIKPIQDMISKWDKEVMIQGVAHGRNHKEFLDCAMDLYHMHVDVIAIPKDYEAWPGGREVLTAMLLDFPVMVHLLGMEKDPWAFTRWHPEIKGKIRSMDTAKPYINGLYGDELFPRNSQNQPIYRKYVRPRDFFDCTPTSNAIIACKQNVQQWKRIYNS